MEPESGGAEEEAGLAVCRRGWVGREAVHGVGTSVKGGFGGGGGAGGLGVGCGEWRLYPSDGDGSFYSTAGLAGRA